MSRCRLFVSQGVRIVGDGGLGCGVVGEHSRWLIPYTLQVRPPSAFDRRLEAYTLDGSPCIHVSLYATVPSHVSTIRRQSSPPATQPAQPASSPCPHR
jgi:hypothetical protein